MSFHIDATKHRRSIRLKGYDYSQPGAYFVTLVTHERKCLFGKIEDGEVRLNDVGRMVEEAWIEVPNHYPGVECDTFLIMPNHIHAVIVLVGAGPSARPEPNGQPRGLPLHEMHWPCRWQMLCIVSKRLRRNGTPTVSNNLAGMLFRAGCGNAIILNTSSETMNLCIASANTFSRTRRAGNSIGRIH